MTRRKFYKIFVASAAVLGLILIVGRLTGTIQFYRVPSASNDPTIKVHSHIFASNFVKPKRLDFICIRHTDTIFGKHIRTYRLCGIEGDKVELRDGKLFINNQSINEKLTLKHSYAISNNDLQKITSSLTDEDIVDASELPSDSVKVTVEDRLIKTAGISATIYLDTMQTEFIKKKWGKDWTRDNFGPVIVPKNKFFLLGDNRHNAEDSRYLGFIDRSKWVGTVLFKK